MKFASRRTFGAAALGLGLAIIAGCGGGEVEPTEAGKQADMKAMEETAAANDAASGGSKKGSRKSQNPGNILPP